MRWKHIVFGIALTVGMGVLLPVGMTGNSENEMAAAEDTPVQSLDCQFFHSFRLSQTTQVPEIPRDYIPDSSFGAQH